MKLLIEVRKGKVNLILFNELREIDQLSFKERNNLSEKLLPEIDELLKRNKLAPRDVKKVVVRADTPESFTTPRIAKAVGKTWNWAVSEVSITSC